MMKDSRQSPPTRIEWHPATKTLELLYTDGTQHLLDAEFLRVYSPSAEVQGHGGIGAVLQTGKRDVTVKAIEPVGNYAIKIAFSDGHDTGLYTWEYLFQLGTHRASMWEDYLNQLEHAGASRDS